MKHRSRKSRPGLMWERQAARYLARAAIIHLDRESFVLSSWFKTAGYHLERSPQQTKRGTSCDTQIRSLDRLA
jgi:hypothetical protein